MKSLLTIFVLLTLAAGAVVSAERPFQISITPAVGVKSGYTKFVMNFHAVWVANAEEIPGSVKSELEYPLDVTVGGLQISIHPNSTAKSEWGVDASYVTNLNDPSNVMKDHDWEYVQGYFDNRRIGYTESRSELKVTQLSLEGFKSVARTSLASCGMIGGFRYQRFYQDIMGVHGSYDIIDTNQYGIPVGVSGTHFIDTNALALTYKVTYAMPYIGLYGRLAPVPNLDFKVKAAFAAVFASDADDHVLRTRMAKASGDGRAFLGGAQVRFSPFGALASTGLFVQADYDVLSLAVKTTGNQVWYGSSDGVPQGTSISGIPHQFTSRQHTVSARVGMTF